MTGAISTTLGVAFAAFAVYLTVRLVNRRERWTTQVATIAMWHLVSLAVYFVYEPTIGRAVLAAYTARFGDVQASYGTFSRIFEYLGLIVMTTTATAASIWFSAALSRRRPVWRQRVMVFAVWEAAAIAVLAWSFEVGFPYEISKFDRAVFGNQEIYSFRTLVLPRIVAWLICTTPIAAVAVLFDRWLSGPDVHGRPPTGDNLSE